ncbi:hypothetical protein [Hungatella sp.]|uniref:hypothetical protein n=1 Tax=Hungatella sp. TaxID=2613924 RepID=UPI003AB2D9D0
MKNLLWLFISDVNRDDVHLAVPTAAWIAEKAGAEFECYLESERDGTLFAKNGSTVLGGRHHVQFNYLNACYDVKYILLGDTYIFRSSIEQFQAEILVQTDELGELYKQLMHYAQLKTEPKIFCAPPRFIEIGERKLEIGPYLYPEIYFGHLLAYPASMINMDGSQEIVAAMPDKEIEASLPETAKIVERIKEGDSYGTITVRIAERWKHCAKGVAFADPPVVLSQLASFCRGKRVTVYDECAASSPDKYVFNKYTEATTGISSEVRRLCCELDNRVIVGRQTGDGDLFEWARDGICIKIIDPNRPAFPLVEKMPHIWLKQEGDIYEDEPDEDQLRQYAKEGKLLASILFHSGEMAHNEAMLNLVEYSSVTGFKIGIGVHAARYETCPQMWELIGIPRSRGGAKGLVEPVLHSGGMGIMAEITCPPEYLYAHCMESLKRIRKIAGDNAVPCGYYAFADTDLQTVSTVKDEIYQSVQAAGLEYFVSTVRPGRNLIIYESDMMIAINQTPKTLCFGSPFARLSSVEELIHNLPHIRPGFMMAAMDSPVVSFNPYIWNKGTDFVKIADYLQHSDGVVNVLPRTVARYAKILREMGVIPSLEENNRRVNELYR